jgi:hypothetical protein
MPKNPRFYFKIHRLKNRHLFIDQYQWLYKEIPCGKFKSHQINLQPGSTYNRFLITIL